MFIHIPSFQLKTSKMKQKDEEIILDNQIAGSHNFVSFPALHSPNIVNYPLV